MAVLNVEVVTRETVVWRGEAKYVRARTAEGIIDADVAMLEAGGLLGYLKREAEENAS